MNKIIFRTRILPMTGVTICRLTKKSFNSPWQEMDEERFKEFAMKMGKLNADWKKIYDEEHERLQVVFKEQMKLCKEYTGEDPHL